MSLLAEYKHSYRGLTISSAATVPSPVAHSLYLRFCWSLIYLLITEVEVSQSAEVGSAQGDAPLFSDAVPVCIKPLLPIGNLMSSAFGCSLSFFSTSLRTAGRLAAEIFFYAESFKGYPGRKHERLGILTHIYKKYFWRGGGPHSRLTFAIHYPFINIVELI